MLVFITRMKLERIVWISLGALTLIRMILGACIELSQDEAYYFLWAERLDWSYYSKGPGVALVLKLTTSIFGDNELGIRVLSPLLGLGSSYLLFLLGKELVGRRAAIWTVVMLNLTPIFNAGSIVLTIDPIMIFFWLAAMLTSWRALQAKDSQAEFKWWALTGLAIGLGFLAKYTILIQLISLILFILVWPDLRGRLRRPGIYVMLGIIVVCTLPVFIWNSQQEWITFRHLADHTESEGFPFRPDLFLEYLGLHLGVYSPLFFAGLMWGLWLSYKHFNSSREENFLACYSLPIVLMYFLLSFKTDGEVNWTAPGFFGLGLLFIKNWLALELPGKRKAWLAGVAIGFSALMTIWMGNPDTLRAVGLSWPYQKDPFLRLRGWESAADEIAGYVQQFREETGEEPFVIANRYQTAAPIAFYYPSPENVFRPRKEFPLIHLKEAQMTQFDLEREREGHRKIQNQFSFWPSYYELDPESGENVFEGRNAIYITDYVKSQNVDSAVRDCFDDTEIVGWFEVRRRGEVLREWKIFACYNYQMRDRLGGGNDE